MAILILFFESIVFTFLSKLNAQKSNDKVIGK